jgi:putative nucleotidyltransferase with HDIG domain
MRDDPLRMLRAVRFETVLSTPEKPFAMTMELEAAIRENARWLESISAERIRDEFEKILISENVAKGLRTLVRLGLIPYTVPEFMETLNVEQEAEFHHKDVFEHTLIVTQNVEPDPILRKAAFFHDIGKPRTLVYEHRCTYCEAKSIQKTAKEGECERCGGRTLPKKIHFYGHENVGAAIVRKAMKRLACPKDEIDAVATSSRTTCARWDTRWGATRGGDSAIRRLYPRYVPESRRPRTRQRRHAPQARPGRHNRQRPQATSHSGGVLAEPEGPRGRDKGRRLRGETREPTRRQRSHAALRRGPGRWIKRTKDYLENEVVEGRLREDDTEKAYELAEAYAREHDIFAEE